ncbi:MAG: cyclic nucleotide-binding domain-containing protein, partial [Leptolyngbyaceae cyanobacterium SM2_3_12]|nr:cyclic nucleotide-binding domain-containing protein [Leptolyngbyaceae cyanobacterium SM2_3_12]
RCTERGPRVTADSTGRKAHDAFPHASPHSIPDHCRHRWPSRTLLHHYNPLVQSVSLYALGQLDADRAKTLAEPMGLAPHPALVRDTAEHLLAISLPATLEAFPRLEKLVYLANSDFFHQLESNTLIALADQGVVKTYDPGEVITAGGDTCRELLLLIDGQANVHSSQAAGETIKFLLPGEALDELEVLAHGSFENTIKAGSENTRILAIPVDVFDNLLDRDPDFARRVLALESQRIQQLMQPSQRF